MSTTTAQTGQLRIHSENIFPIIKQFLYSDQEVFLRELVSNAVDAVQKLRTLAAKGEASGDLGEGKVTVTINEAAKTLTISDNGIGMTAEEVEKYINQIAFSSATEFVEQYKDAEEKIIGHFGLGFYSAFMVAQKVELVTKSYREGAEAVRWTNTGDTNYTLEPAEREGQGTDVILHISPDAEEYLKSARIKEVLTKYGKFLPVPVEFEKAILNNPTPAWTRPPADLTDEDYKNFYRELYPYSEEPLFWIHLNVDYPFTLKGILYFPRIRPQLDADRNKIQLYQNQVFVTDDVENVVPEYLTLLHGVLDSPDIPLNVSRSYLQTDANVRKIAQHISKKVADRLRELFDEDRDAFQEKWESVGVFVKYGMMRDEKFRERAQDFLLLKNSEDKLFTVSEYKDHIREHQEDKNNKLVALYTTDPDAQDSYIQAAHEKKYDVLLFNGVLDINFVTYFESFENDVLLKRVDAEPMARIIDKGIETGDGLNEEEKKVLEEVFEKAIANKLIAVRFEALEETDLPVSITRPEHQRRMEDMAAYGVLGSTQLPKMYTVVVNSTHTLVKRLLLLSEGDAQVQLATHLYELAQLAQGLLNGRQLTEFIGRNLGYLERA